MSNCMVCGAELKGRQRKFCSSKCYYKDYYNRNKDRIKEKSKEYYHKTHITIIRHTNCIICETELKGNQRFFCSDYCKLRGYVIKNRARVNKKSKEYYRKTHPAIRHTNCLFCEAELKGRQRRFCSNKCRSKQNYMKKINEVLNKLKINEEIEINGTY